MSAMLDYIASAIIFGVLVLAVARVQGNINQTLYQNTFTVITQGNAVELARQVEFDFLKIGHHVQGQRIFYAAERRLDYRADVLNNMDTLLYRYQTGTIAQAANTFNPIDFPLFRVQAGVALRQNFGLVDFRIAYFDSNNVRIGVPTTNADTLAKIRGINVQFIAASPEPVIGSAGDTTYSVVTWQKLVFPRNLNQLNLTK
jgi:hypothetical protein